MIRTKLRVFALSVFIICPLLFFVACEPLDRVVNFFADDGTGYIFRYAISRIPGNLDPQLAEDDEAVMISKNLFAGLLDIDESGRPVGRVAKDYVISSDGLTYTFYLNEGYTWYATGEFTEPVTAKDFVFGFRRLMDPKTSSPHSEKYFCISGAQEARSGIAPVEDIGVKAIDDYTLEFTLCRQNAEFLYLLTELPAMPCCEKFFNENAGGKYGLEAESTCSDGPFYIRYWQHDPYGKDNYVRLRRNPEYSELSYVSPAGINYLVNSDYESRKADYIDGTTEVMLYLPNRSPDTDAGAICRYADTAGIVFNESVKAFADPDIRQIFSWAVDRDALSETAPDVLKPASALIPDDSQITSRGYSFSVPEGVSVSDADLAEYKWSYLLTDRQKSELIGMTLMAPSDFEYGYVLEGLTESWYQSLRIHFNVDIVNPRDYEERLKSGDYDMALVTVSSKTASPIDYIEAFGKDGEFGIHLESADNAASARGSYASLSALSYSCSEAEREILSDFHFIPLWHLPTVCAFDTDVEGLRLDPFSRTVYFEDAKKF